MTFLVRGQFLEKILGHPVINGLAVLGRLDIEFAGFVLAGEVDPDAVLTDAAELAAAELPWESSRLIGQAAVRTTDASAARRLLERARELTRMDPVPDESRPGASHGGLSDREVEVARLVLAGRTHREIGTQLFLSPKTVEHHVARIRGKLGVTTRAEMVATLRSLLPEES